MTKTLSHGGFGVIDLGKEWTDHCGEFFQAPTHS